MSLLALLISPPAEAIIYVGNPVNLSFYVDRTQHDLVEGSVGLDTVRIHACGGGYTDYEVDALIDPVAGYDLDIASGNYCSVTLYWSTDMTLEVSGNGAFTMLHEDNSTNVTLAAPIAPVALTPFEVTSGTFYGNNPGLVMVIE